VSEEEFAHRRGGVLILGGTGFIGRHVRAAFEADGRAVLVASRGVAAGATPPDRQLRLDLARVDADELAGLLSRLAPRIVVNCTGGIWGLTPEQMRPAMLDPVLRLLDAVACQPTRPRLIHLGSVLEYGPVPAGTAVGPQLEPRPADAYGRAKLAATQAVAARAGDGAVDAVALRVANAAGPGAPALSLFGRVAGVLAAADQGETATVLLDPLRAKRDYIDVRDVADAVVAAAARAQSGTVAAVGRGQAVAVRDLVEALVRISAVPARIVEREPDAGERGLGHTAQEWMQVDPDHAYEAFGWRARREPVEALRDLWRETVAAHHRVDVVR